MTIRKQRQTGKEPTGWEANLYTDSYGESWFNKIVPILDRSDIPEQLEKVPNLSICLPFKHIIEKPQEQPTEIKQGVLL